VADFVPAGISAVLRCHREMAFGFKQQGLRAYPSPVAGRLRRELNRHYSRECVLMRSDRHHWLRERHAELRNQCTSPSANIEATSSGLVATLTGASSVAGGGNESVMVLPVRGGGSERSRNAKSCSSLGSAFRG